MWLKEFLDLLSLETGLPAPRSCLPNWVVWLAACGGEAVDYLNPRSKGARVCLETAAQVENGGFFNNARTRAELDWEPVRSVRDSIHQAVAWFRDGEDVEMPEGAGIPCQDKESGSGLFSSCASSKSSGGK
jgi:nucleoside-diphosphate-sugar epimerase